MFADWSHELRQAFRSLLRTPGFALLAIGTLGLAIGANTGIFTVVEKVLLDPLPFEESDRLVVLRGTAPGTDLPEEFNLPGEFFVEYSENSELLSDLATYNSFTNTLRVEDRVERVRMSVPAHSLFETLGARPLFGRLPVPEDESDVLLISHGLWTTWFGADPDVLGRTVYAAGEDRTIIGVMEPDFWFPNDGTLLWIPRTLRPEQIRPGGFGQPLVARLADGASAEALATELGMLARRLPDRFGGSANYSQMIEQFRPTIQPLETELLGDVSGPLWILLAAMGIVLIIACANVANLFMVRAERRQGDLAVRRALGAGRSRLMGSQLAESVVIAGLAGLLAVGIAWVGVPLLIEAAPASVPRLADVALSPITLLFTFGVSVIAALLCGLGPALRFSVPSLSRLRESGRSGMRRSHWGQNTLVAGQTALALVLLIGSALLLRSLDALRQVDPGYETTDIFTFQFAPEGEHLQDAPSYARLHMDFMDRLAALPGVERVGIVNNVPLDEGVGAGRFHTETSANGTEPGTLLSFTQSAGDYFRTLGIDVLAGRTFTPEDNTSQLGNILISRSAAELLWPGEDPIGKRLRDADPEADPETWETVVGVVDDVLQYGFRRPAEPMIYFPLVGQDVENSRPIGSPGYVVKTARAEEIAPEVRALVREVSPFAPMYRVYTMEQLAERSMVQLAFTSLTLGVAAAMALILGIVGLYGVLSYAVAERTREIGLRMALGAAAQRVRLMVVGQGARVLGVGVAVGAVIAFLVTRSLDSLLFGVEAFDLGTYFGVSALLVVVGLAATYLPARRASKVDPMESLRSE